MTKKEMLNMCNIYFKPSQKKLKSALEEELKANGYETYKGDGFLYAQGNIKILLVAHMDTVHKEKCTEIFIRNKNELYSPQGIGGDDRCGIYMIMQIIKQKKCSVLFTEDEEIGGIGANKFIKTQLARELIGKFNYIIELDRKGNKDAVFYNCDNPEFTQFITKEYFKEDFGSYSDISDIAPFLEAAAVNLSSGYYKAHTTDEYINVSEMETIHQEVIKLIDRTTEEDKFEYIESKYNYWGYRSFGFYDRNDYNEFDYSIMYYDNDELSEELVTASSEYEALGIFLFEHPDMSYNQIECITEV